MISFITLLAAVVRVVSSEHYHIVPVNSTTLCQHYSNGTCFTLDQLSSRVNGTGDMNISFLPGEHLLTWNITFINRTNITLNSEQWDKHSNSAPKISCVPYIGIDVRDTETFTVQGLVIYGCKRYDHGYAIRLLRTTAVIKNSTFKNNSMRCDNKRGCFSGAAALHSNDSAVIIDSCVFEQNMAWGNAFVVVTYRGTLHIINSTFKALRSDYGGTVVTIDAAVHIINSAFEYNTGPVVLLSGNVQIIESRFEYNSGPAVLTGGSSAGGNTILHITRSSFQYNTADFIAVVSVLSQIIQSNFVNCVVSAIITESRFEYNNGRTIITDVGSTLHITNSTIQHNAVNIEVRGGAVTITNGTISDTLFRNNSAHHVGGALLIQGLAWITNSRFEYNTVSFCGGAVGSLSSVLHITNSAFDNNEAFQGGALCLVERSETIVHTSGMNNNRASYGGAVYLEQISTLKIDGDVTITDNSATQVGGGIFSLLSTIDLRYGNTQILSNAAQQDGGGIYLSASSFSINGKTLTIDNNTAQNYGGGLYLQDRSKLQYGDPKSPVPMNTTINFKNNTAVRGSAIYVSDSGSGPVCCDELDNNFVGSNFKQCFIQSIFPPIWMYMYFENNNARESGSDIYGGLLDRCSVRGNIRGINFMLKQFSWALGSHVQNVDQLHNYISSDPVRVCFCENDVILCNYTHPTVFKKKGETFTLSITAVDQVGKPVNATLISSLPWSKNGRLKGGQQFRKIGDQCTDLEYNVYSSDPTVSLQVYADGPCGNQGISKQDVNITFEPCTCPVGFDNNKQDLIKCSCDCANELKLYISNCSPENKTIQVNKNIWIQHINHTNSTRQFVTQTCPFDYCVQKPVNISLADPDQQCAFNRTGRLCGQCGQGLSLMFASSRCQQCLNYHLFLLLPFALAGIALVVFILLLNMTVATGTIHGLIFYANILAANQSIFLPFDTPNFLTVFISWLNLDLGIETCFYNGMESYAKFLLQLVFPSYVFLLIAIIMVLCNRSQRIAALFGKKNPEATLYTLILLSYSKLIRIIITALQFALIDYTDGWEMVWLFDANVIYFTASHIPRFFAAFIITILGAVYTILLLFGQVFNRCSEYRLMKWTTHKYYIHFLKAHHAPLSDKHRYWVGLLLLVRLVHYLISAFADESIVILSIGTIAGALLFLKNNRQIYNKWSVDLLETVFIANLNIFSLSTFYVIINHQGDQQALATVSMSISFIAFMGMVLYHILVTCGVKLTELPNKVITKIREHHNYRPVTIIEEQLEDDEELLQLDEVNNYDVSDSHDGVNDSTRYITPPIIRSAVRADQLREPALDDLIPIQPEDYSIPPAPRPQHREPTFTEINIRAREN